jgi:SHS2 domain-containing protein
LAVEQPVNPRPFYKTIEHTADIGIEVEAPDREGIFTRSALAMFDLMFGLESIGHAQKRRISVTGDGLDELLIAWLNDLIYVYSVDKIIFGGFSEADLGENRFSAVASGEHIVPGKHRADLEVKAATYHDLSVSRSDGGWIARIIFDV